MVGLDRKLLTRILMIGPPILFVVYMTHSLSVIRGLLSQSTSFHQDYANELIQDYLASALVKDEQALMICHLQDGENCQVGRWVTTQGEGEPLVQLNAGDGKTVPMYLRRDNLATTLQTFFENNEGLRNLFESRYHEPVYWFRILNPDGKEVFRSGPMPAESETPTTYAMDRSLRGFTVEILYRSFGAKQLYSVARTRINFGAIFFLFLLAVFSAFLVTRSIRQKIQMARQKSFFVSTVSHEFKTPLAILKLATETLVAKRFKSPGDEARFLGMLENEINRLDHLVHKVLSFNKIETGQIHFQEQHVDLRTILQNSCDAFKSQAQSEQVDLVVAMPEEPCIIKGDHNLIRHAFDNLVDNAFKYRGKSKRIELTCERDDQAARLVVRDHGIGIPRGDLPHILKSFFRGESSAKQGIRGSGLGLAISQFIVKNSRGRLGVESRPGEGSTFTMSFPLAKARAV